MLGINWVNIFMGSITKLFCSMFICFLFSNSFSPSYRNFIKKIFEWFHILVLRWERFSCIPGFLKNQISFCAPAIFNGGVGIVWTGASQVALVEKKPLQISGDVGCFPELRKSPGDWHGKPLQSSCLENPRDRGACWGTVHGVAESNKTKAT